MNVQVITVGAWLDLAVTAAREVLEDSFGMDCEEKPDAADREASTSGAFIPLLYGQDRLQLAVLSTDHGCAELARVFLGMADDDDPLPPGDIADAVAEIANVLSGVMQRSVDGNGSALELGLPIFIHGDVDTSHMETASRRMSVGGVDTEIRLIRGTPDHRVRQ